MVDPIVLSILSNEIYILYGDKANATHQEGKGYMLGQW